MAKQYLTLDDANALLPHVVRLMVKALQLQGHLRIMVQQLSDAGLQVTPAVLSGDSEIRAAPELIRSYAVARGLYDGVQECVQAISALGGEVKDLQTGLVDFYSLLDGQTEVLLCWRVGEDHIEFFHEPHSGFDGRRPVMGHQFSAEPQAIQPS